MAGSKVQKITQCPCGCKWIYFQDSKGHKGWMNREDFLAKQEEDQDKNNPPSKKGKPAPAKKEEPPADDDEDLWGEPDGDNDE